MKRFGKVFINYPFVPYLFIGNFYMIQCGLGRLFYSILQICGRRSGGEADYCTYPNVSALLVALASLPKGISNKDPTLRRFFRNFGVKSTRQLQLEDVHIMFEVNFEKRMSRKEVSKLAATNQKANEALLPPRPNDDSQFVKLLRNLSARVLDDAFVQTVLAMMTIWALFGPDIQYSTPYTSYLGCQVAISVIFFIFVVEIAMSCLARPDYFPSLPDFARLPTETFQQSVQRRLNIGSFYFYLDWIATLSLLFEMDWVTGANRNVGATESAQTGTYSRAGARAGRIIRLVRMVRLVRLVKLYKYTVTLFSRWSRNRTLAAAAKKEGLSEKQVKEMVAVANNDEDEEEEKVRVELHGESEVGQRMADLTNRRVIILVLSLLIVVPQLQGSPSDLSINLAAQMLQRAGSIALNNKDPSKTQAYAEAFAFTVSEMRRILPIVSMSQNYVNGSALRIPGVDPTVSAFELPIYSQLRYDELNKVKTAYDPLLGGLITTIALNIKDKQLDASILSIGLTLFIIGLLVLGTMSFTSAIGKLVIGPIEKMVALVQEISIDPLGADYKDMTEEDGFIQGMETTTLLITINKIGGLMRVGFGEAGASVIGRALGNSGRLNLIADGVMIRSIFGFCDVRQFTDTTECLQEEVMLFVNRIAHILHSIVVQCSGSANKNIGDAFLLTWKLDGLSTEQTTSLADQALLCFCKALIELARYQTFICNFSPAATQRLYKRFPGYVVRIGSGLHVGWAVEGAIGSNRKIDASYLSPHVNFTEFLESSTKAYGVPLLISEPFFKMLSPAAARYVRKVDRIKKPGEDPISMYTYDSDIWIDWTEIDEKKETVRLRHEKRTKALKEAKAAKDGKKSVSSFFGAATGSDTDDARRGSAAVEQKQRDAARKTLKGAPDICVFAYTEEVWDDDEDLVQLRHHVDAKFREIWRGGIEAYIEGFWQKARKNLELCLELSNGKDGPSKFLLERIAEDGPTESPADWPGYRAEGGGH